MYGTNSLAQAPFAATGGNAFTASVSESAVAQDVLAAAVNFAVQFSDSATAADAVASQFSIFSSVSEAAQGADTTSASFLAGASVSEIATVSGVPAAIAAFLALNSETVTASDSIFSVPNYAIQVAEGAQAFAFDAAVEINVLANVAESVSALDTPSSRELWELIDDTQNSVWVDILVPITVQDIAVFGGGNFGTLAFAGNLNEAFNPNPAVWNEIDDTQNTTWTDIVAV